MAKNNAHFKQAEIWNKAEPDKRISFKLAKLQAQIKYEQFEIMEAKKWTMIAYKYAEMQGVKLTNEGDFLKEFTSKNKSNSYG